MNKYTELRFKGTEEEINQQWLDARKQGIGGSDAAAIMGMSKYGTPLTVWLEKTGREESPDLSDNEYVYWGNVLESVVAEEFSKRHPEYIMRRKNALLRSKKYPFMQASLDFVLIEKGTGRKGILEIKTASAHLDGDWEEDIPDYYLPQPTHYLAVTGYDFYAVAVLIGGNQYREFINERDLEDIDALIKRETDFWNNYVLTDIMPEVTGSKADTESLTAIHSISDDEYEYLLDIDVPEIEQYQNTCEALKALEEKKRELANLIRVKVGDLKGIVTHTKKVTWIRSKVNVFDKKTFAEECPEIYQQYQVSKPRDGGLRISEVK